MTNASVPDTPVIPELLYLALDFYREPRRFEHLRQVGQPLPPGITELLAAPSHSLADEAIEATADALHASKQECLACVPFFIKQVMLEGHGDYYRMLGVDRDATQAQVKEHYFYLMRLFHPDRDVHNEGWDDLYAPRINEAYNTLRNSARRAAYDASLPGPDGFNPEQLSEAVQTAPQRSFSNAEKVSPLRTTPGFLRSPWFYAVLAGLMVLILFSVLFGSNQSNQLTVTQTERVSTADVVAAEIERSTTAPEQQISLPRDTLREPRDSRQGASEEDIEALVRARVNQATVAVLGRPRPKAKAPVAPASRPAVQPVPDPDVVSESRPAVRAGLSPQVVPEGRSAGQPELSPQVVAEGQPAVQSAMDPQVVPETPQPAVIAEQTTSEVAVAVAQAPEAETVSVALVSNEQPDPAPVEPAPPVTESPATVGASSTPALPALESAIAAEMPLRVSETLVEPEAVAPTQQQAPLADVVAESSPDPVQPQQSAPPTPSGISNADVESLLLQFANAYEAGDATQFAHLFSPDARTTDANGRPAIERLYAGFFAETAVHEFRIDALKLSGKAAAKRDCRASVSIITQPASGGERSLVEADIRFDIARDATGALQITRMRY